MQYIEKIFTNAAFPSLLSRIEDMYNGTITAGFCACSFYRKVISSVIRFIPNTCSVTKRM